MRNFEKCFSCGLEHEKVEVSGIWHCPNALCRGVGGHWFRSTLSSYKEGSANHIVDWDEWQSKGKIHNEKNNIKVPNESIE